MGVQRSAAGFAAVVSDVLRVGLHTLLLCVTPLQSYPATASVTNVVRRPMGPRCTTSRSTRWQTACSVHT